jgi:hypothetical protein
MGSPILLGWKALADIFTVMASQKAHWYNGIAPLDSDPLRHEIYQVFPPLSSLLNIDVPIMNKVLEASGWCQKR